jgi:hypothetical protein
MPLHRLNQGSDYDAALALNGPLPPGGPLRGYAPEPLLGSGGPEDGGEALGDLPLLVLHWSEIIFIGYLGPKMGGPHMSQKLPADPFYRSVSSAGAALRICASWLIRTQGPPVNRTR